MPTYSFRCPTCGRTDDHFLSMGDYIRNAPTFFCCAAPMERLITVSSAPACANALASDRHYDGLRAPDGADISSRTKHRAYMKANNLTTVDDFKQTWATQATERQSRMDGHDSTRARDVAEAVRRHGG